MAASPSTSRRYRIVLAPESPNDETDSTETIYSMQDKETEFVRDESDTCTKSDSSEYTVYSLPSEQNPFIDSESSDVIIKTENIVIETIFQTSTTSSSLNSHENDNGTHSSSDSELGQADYWHCVQCLKSNNHPKYRYCMKCFQLRKEMFPPPPKGTKKRTNLLKKNANRIGSVNKKRKRSTDSLSDVEQKEYMMNSSKSIRLDESLLNSMEMSTDKMSMSQCSMELSKDSMDGITEADKASLRATQLKRRLEDLKNKNLSNTNSNESRKISRRDDKAVEVSQTNGFVVGSKQSNVQNNVSSQLNSVNNSAKSNGDLTCLANLATLISENCSPFERDNVGSVVDLGNLVTSNSGCDEMRNNVNKTDEMKCDERAMTTSCSGEIKNGNENVPMKCDTQNGQVQCNLGILATLAQHSDYEAYRTSNSSSVDLNKSGKGLHLLRTSSLKSESPDSSSPLIVHSKPPAYPKSAHTNNSNTTSSICSYLNRFNLESRQSLSQLWKTPPENLKFLSSALHLDTPKTSRTFQELCEEVERRQSMNGLTEDSGLSSGSASSPSLCIMCERGPKNAGFVHMYEVHVCSCYACALKAWKKTKKCPICNLRASKVMKVIIS